MPTLPVALDVLAANPAGPARRRGRVLWRQFASALGWPPESSAPAGDPRAARAALLTCLADLPPIDSRALRQLLAHAQSLAELWHLRPEVYRTLALHHSQAEAERRLAPLSLFFDGWH